MDGQNQIPPPPDGSEAVSTGQSIPPPPDGSGIVDNGQAAQPTHNDELKITAPITSQEGQGQRIASGLEGLGEGVFSTLGGIDDMVSKIPVVGHFLTTPIGEKPTAENSQAARRTVHQLAGDNNTPGSSNDYNKVGYGGETLAEFMLGDEALKGMSQADALGTVSKWMKIAEKSPRLIRALQTGADVEKVAAEAGLSPQEIAFIRNKPTIAKYVSIGVNALRAGTVQGGQTLARSGGNVKEAAEDAAGTAAVGGVLGTVAHEGASLLRKGSKAAQTVADMNDVAANAPTAHQVEEGLGKTVNNAFSNETGTLQNNLNDANSQVGMFGEGAPQQTAITTAAQKAAKTGNQAVHAAYQAGLDHLVELAGKQTIPYEGSPLQKAAQELASYTPEEAGPLDQTFQVAQPGSPKANSLIDRLANFGQESGEEGEAPQQSSILQENGKPFEKPAPEEEPVTADLTMQHLVARRQSLAKIIRNLGPNDRPDRVIYGKLLEGIDDTIGNLADHIGKPVAETSGDEVPKTQARQLFDQMNQQYREGIRPFQNRDVRNILKGNLNDVAKSIMGGQTSLQDIADVKQALGPQNFQAVARASLQNIVQSFMDQGGELDYKKLFQKINKIDPQVRTAMFGDQGKALADALKVANDSASGLTEIGKQVNDLLGNGNIDTLLKDPKRVKDIANLVGPDGMKILGRSIFQNQVKQASTVRKAGTAAFNPDHFDPEKVIKWWESLKDSPEVRDAFFTVDKDSVKYYDQMMKQLDQSASVKKLVKYGVLPATMGAIGSVISPAAGFWATVAGLGTERFGFAQKFLDKIANSPRTWKTLAFGGKVANKASNAATPEARRVSAAAVYQGVKHALSGNDVPIIQTGATAQ